MTLSVMTHFRLKSSPMSPISSSGFTLVELVMVIVLIGILSVGVQSLFSSKDAYVDYVAKERLLSMGLLAQQLALGVSANPLTGPAPTTDPASMSISAQPSGHFQFDLFKHGQLVQSYQVENPQPSISVDAVNLAAGGIASLAWNREASMKDSANHIVTLSGAQSFRVCFSSSGYVYEC